MTYINFNRRILLDTGSSDTVEGAVIRAGGKHILNEVTLNANNTTAVVNLFEFTGTIDIIAIHGHVTDATTMTNLTNLHLVLNQSSNSTQIPITKTSGASLSGMPASTYLIKDADSSVAISVLNATNQQLKEPTTGNKAMLPFIITAKNGATNWISMVYSTTDAPINAKIEWHVHYADINTGTITLP